ncbi:MAG TPA: hypothetical protein VFI33_12345, partial [Puia sp.]|nr:hypothetical protein [Puia sp.]
MIKKRTLFKLRINISDLDQHLATADPCTGLYDAELITDEKNLVMKIFYPGKEYLGSKIQRWAHNREDKLLSYFEVTEVIEPSYLTAIDFMDYSYKGMTVGSFVESNHFTIKLTGVRRKFSGITDETTEFYLNKQGFSLVEMNYRYPLRMPWTTEPFKWEPTNEVTDYVKFDKIEFKPEHNFFNSNNESESEISIQKEPKIIVKHEDLSEVDIKRHVSLLCSLFSFYAHENIDYVTSKIQTKEDYFYEARDTEENSNDGHGLFRWDFSQNPLNLIVNVNAPHLLANLEFVQNIITRYNYALQLDGESKFMILYNILEQIRNQYILDGKIDLDKNGQPSKPKKVIQEYKFNKSK